MAHRILITALFDDASSAELSYYCTKVHGKTLYCDAFLPAEAACKFVLSSYPIDEIIVFGSEGAVGPKEETAALRKRESSVPSDMETATEFSILQYRLMQFFDDIRIEDADRNSLLSEEEQQQTRDFLRRFFRERVDPAGEKQFSRFFHYLIQDAAVRDDMEDALRLRLSVSEADLPRYQSWILQFLFRGLKATSKPELLERNAGVRIRSFCTGENNTLSVLRCLMPVLSRRESGDGEPDSTELIVFFQDNYSSVMFDLLNAMNLSKIIPSSQIRIRRVITETQLSGLPVYELQDQTEKHGISELLAATGAFLSYGKTDLMVEYWKKTNRTNPAIERMIYAMRNIDSGISLCDIADLERGIRSLRAVMQNDLPIAGESIVEQYFQFVAESIRQDYGSLLETDQLPFIDLVRWAYRKGFLQQVLTLIESRAPDDFVDRGIFFYSDGERTRAHALEILGQIYYDLKPHEKYKLEDVSHYFIKYYSRGRASHSDGDDYQLRYADIRIGELDTRDESLIRAHTVCPDRSALKDLLFAYYHLSDVRNQTNHAIEEFGGFYTIAPDSDPGERRKLITQAIDYFLHCYDAVCELVKGKKANVVKIENSEIVDYAKTLRYGNRRSEGSSSVQDRGRSSTPPADKEEADPAPVSQAQPVTPTWKEFK